MSHYVHHIPGRLRVKSALLKRNEPRAVAVRALLGGMQGVVGCEVKTLTGSVVVCYEPAVVGAHTIMSVLEAEGFIAGQAARVDEHATVRSRAGTIAGRVGKAAAGVLVEKLVERSAVALIGAIL
jgi:hypothetical protein